MKFLIVILFLIRFNPALYSQEFKSDIFFSGERVPVEYKFISKKLSLAISSNYKGGKRFNEIKSKADFYFPYVEAMLKKHGIPDDFKYLLIAESDLSRGAVSSAGAGGFWQFMPNTAKDLGLIVQYNTDERQSIVKSTIAACLHINSLYKRLGNWTLAAAAYNVGAGSIQRSLAKQRIRNYYFLSLNEETGNYLYRILAAKIIFGKSNNLVIKVVSEVNKKPSFNKGSQKLLMDTIFYK